MRKLKLIEFLKKVYFNPLFSGSLLMVLGSNFSNFLAYLYHLFFGRILLPQLYGELAAGISLLGLFGTFFNFLGIVIVKFIASSESKNLPGTISWFVKRISIIGLCVSLVIMLFSAYISDFTKVGKNIIFLIALIYLLGVFSFVLRSVLQGLMKFKEVVIVSNLEMLGRLVLGYIFVILGFGVFGAFLGMFFSAVLVLLVTRYFLKEYSLLSKSLHFRDGKRIFAFALPSFLFSLATNSFFSIDLILVKHFLDSYQAGIYASLSTLGKVIFFGASPISSVMFPMISKRYNEGKRITNVFFLSVFLTITISAVVLLIYFLFPELAIRILYGSGYIEGARYLFLFGLNMTIFTISSLIVSFFLSKDTTNVVFLGVFASILQALGIWIFHKGIYDVVRVSLVSSTLFLVSLLIYLGYEYKKRKFRS